MKTIFNWLLELPDDISGKAIKNAVLQLHRNKYDIYEYEVDDMRDAINYAFNWGNSIQGHAYWKEISDRYKDLK